MAENILVMVTKPPYGFEEAFAGLRLSLAMLASGVVFESTVLLVEDGTLNAVCDQKPQTVGMPSNKEALDDLPDLDIDVYCIEEDLRKRFPDVEVADYVKMIDWEQARQMINTHDLVTTF